MIPIYLFWIPMYLFEKVIKSAKNTRELPGTPAHQPITDVPRRNMLHNAPVKSIKS